MMEHERVTRRKASAKETVSIGNFPTRMKRILIPRRRPSAFSNFDLQDSFLYLLNLRGILVENEGHGIEEHNEMAITVGSSALTVGISPQCGLQCIEVHGLHNLNDGRSYRTVSCRHIFSRMKVANLHQNWIAHKMQII